LKPRRLVSFGAPFDPEHPQEICHASPIFSIVPSCPVLQVMGRSNRSDAEGSRCGAPMASPMPGFSPATAGTAAICLLVISGVRILILSLGISSSTSSAPLRSASDRFEDPNHGFHDASPVFWMRSWQEGPMQEGLSQASRRRPRNRHKALSHPSNIGQFGAPVGSDEIGAPAAIDSDTTVAADRSANSSMM
jgi:hypothetical protein